MDNAFFHHSVRDQIRTACEAVGVRILYLPPYSPDFNPIEESFADLKSYIRRWYHEKRGGFDTYQEFLEWAVRMSGTGPEAAKRARGHFRNAGVGDFPAKTRHFYTTIFKRET